MKRFLSLLILALVAIASVVSCVKQEDIDNLQSQIDDIKSVQIATIDQQIAGIKTSLASLQETDKELKGYISTLQNTASELQRSINSTNDKIDRVEADLKKDLSDTQSNLANDIITAKTELLTSLTALRTDMATHLAVINTNISNLQEKDVALEEKIDDLKTYVDGEIKNTKDWASATFATLEQYNALVTEIAGIKANITSINTAISELETRLNGKIASDIAAAVSTLEGELQQQATDITQAYKEAIATAKGEIETAYTNAITTAIASSESAMQVWVNGRLTGYYTIAETDAKLTTLKQSLETEIAGQKTYLEGVISVLETVLTEKIENNGTLIANLQTKVNGLRDDLSALAETVTTNTQTISQLRSNLTTAISDITSAYNSAISAAIAENNGTINAKIAADITTATNALQQQIDAINTRINNLESRVTTLETNVEDLINRIQGIEVIPSYSDGSVACTMGNNEFYFEVLPSGSASRLAAAGKNIFKLKAVYTQTKSTPSFENLPISSVRAEGDILVVTASASGLTITAEQSANAVLTVTSGISSISTGYFPLFFAANSLVVNASLSASTPFSASFTCNVSKAGGITEYGICYSEGNSLCNNTTTSHNMDETGVFTVDLTSLTPKTSYYYRAYAIIGGVAMYSGLKTFATEEISTEMIHTTEINDVTAFSAHCSGNIDSRLLDYPSIIIGICYSNITDTPTLSDYYFTVSSISQTGEFSSTLTGLMPNSSYHCRVYAKLGEETIYGNVLSFNTSTSEDIVFTLSCDNISYSTITLKGKVNVPNDSYESIAMGFYYNTTNSFDQYTNHVFVSSLGSDDTFIADISVFENTQYYYKAFAVIDGTTFYGNVLSVTSSEIQVSTNAILDLGLSVKWAGSNVGAASPELMGNTYAWGELTANKTVNYLGWDSYKYCMGTEYSITKYNTDANRGAVDNKTRLEYSDDAAYQLSGGTRRIPTKDEMSELLNNCTWIWGSYKGVPGFKIISKIDGYQNNVMFLPANKSDDEMDHGYAGAAYWTSDLRYPQQAYRLYISNSDISKELGGYDRAYPYNIRAVIIE